ITLGQESLPERIRIHSSILLAILDKIHGTEISKDGDAVVMLRPFKALTLYKTQLQDWYSKLERKFSPRVEEEGSTAQAVSSSEKLQTPTSDTQMTGVETEAPSQIENTVASDTHDSKQDEGVNPSPNASGATPNKEDDITMSLAAFNHLRCLLEFMDTTIIQKQNYLKEHCQRVSFVDLWHLFRPGVEVVEPGDKQMQCYKVISVTSPRHKVTPRYLYPLFRNKGKGETAVSVHCVYIDFDGSLIGPVSKRFEIPRYEGQKDVKSLPVYPLSLVKNKDTIRQALIKRGDKFLKVLRVGHMHYNGLTLEARDEVDSQVVVDFAEALANREDRKNEDWKPEVQLRAELEKKPKENGPNRRSDDDSDGEDDGEGCNADCCKGDNVHNDNYVDEKQYEQFLTNLLADTDEEENPASLAVLARILKQDKAISVTDDDKVIMSHRVFAFVLRSRSWAKLDLEGLVDLEEYRKKQEKERPAEEKNENAFDNLVFPEDGLDRKTIVRSLVAQHFRDKESGATREEQSDIIRGKGKGLIILLHGAPGVGKTTTAEGIAELFDKPLFQITCGDLGTTAREVEAALETNFALANKWGSILLLDEADVFLARRTPQDFKRNGLVAVFLRVLEYYAGILFLTTNRIGDFDEAFSSRIHISLHYPALDYDSTVGIFELNWRLMKARFAHKGRTLDIDTTKITGFITNYWYTEKNARWNGRQIRNACQTALALAEFEAQGTGEEGARNPDAKVCLGVSHMKTVANAYLEFIKYLQDVRDADQERYAYLMGIRRREARGAAPED
ncbi:P-loop containing nucleoside triphosphate hydrolase protein, partial [Hypoxylon sp. EC38]